MSLHGVLFAFVVEGTTKHYFQLLLVGQWYTEAGDSGGGDDKQ